MMADKNLTKNMRSADNIKRMRVKVGLTQEQLGEIIGVTSRQVANWEAGNSLPNDANKMRLEKLFYTGEIEKDLIQLDPDRNALLFSTINNVGLIGALLVVLVLIAVFLGLQAVFSG
jgi:transcriptional regulator with XRE-family HTH domain